MTNDLKRDVNEVAAAAGWSLAYARGYLDGIAFRRRGVKPSGDLLQATSDYALGLQTGYHCDTGLLSLD